MTEEIQELIRKITSILYDIDDHRWESFPYFTLGILKVFGHKVSEEDIQSFIDQDEEEITL